MASWINEAQRIESDCLRLFLNRTCLQTRGVLLTHNEIGKNASLLGYARGLNYYNETSGEEAPAHLDSG